MEFKVDLAQVIKMMVNSENEGIEEAIESTKSSLETIKRGLNTSYERLEEAEAENNERQIFIISKYIEYLENCIPVHESIIEAYTDLRELNRVIDMDMNKGIMM